MQILEYSQEEPKLVLKAKLKEQLTKKANDAKETYEKECQTYLKKFEERVFNMTKEIFNSLYENLNRLQLISKKDTSNAIEELDISEVLIDACYTKVYVDKPVNYSKKYESALTELEWMPMIDVRGLKGKYVALSEKQYQNWALDNWGR